MGSGPNYYRRRLGVFFANIALLAAGYSIQLHIGRVFQISGIIVSH